MRAAIYQGQKNILLTQLGTPVPGDNDILVKNLYASICGTDVAVYQHGPNTGHRVTVGGEFEHEMVSQVVQTGKNITGIHVGDQVYPYPLLAKGDPRRAGTVGGLLGICADPQRGAEQAGLPDSGGDFHQSRLPD